VRRGGAQSTLEGASPLGDVGAAGEFLDPFPDEGRQPWIAEDLAAGQAPDQPRGDGDIGQGNESRLR
jgi:hypothetical protein